MSEKQQMLSAEESLNNYLLIHYNKNISTASIEQLYVALAMVSKEIMYLNRSKLYNDKNSKNKVIHYMSVEFLIGRNLRNNLWNLGLEKYFADLLLKNNKNIQDVYDIEKDAGLGNGGLGRLASCFLDSLATLNYPAFGHCIKYEYGLFNQSIVDGRQIEKPDEWLSTGNIWLEERRDQSVDILIGGSLKQTYYDNRLSYENVNPVIIKAIPYDMLISGYKSNTCSTLRLWEAKGVNKFDIKKFDRGEFAESLKEKNELEALNKVLYPCDSNEKGKNLRLIQEYFLVSSAMQNILQNYFENNSDLTNLPNQVAIHINDTHPVLSIPELMRLLMDKYCFGWEESWNVVSKVVSYTNHTILSEALEVKNIFAIEKIVPRIAMIIREIDKRFRNDLSNYFNGDIRKIEQLAIIQNNYVHMANMAIYTSYAINGVSNIHTNILKTKLFSAYTDIYPNKLLNITNGVTHRRWLSQCNPKLNKLIKSLIGKDFYLNPEKLKELNQFIEDKEVLKSFDKIKYENKKAFAEYIKKTKNIDIDPNARFDVHVKRIHEYKRQLLNVMRIIYLCNKIRENPNDYVTPQVFIFAGKAASGYAVAKRIIKLINQLSLEVNNDPVLSDKIKVIFVENYNVTLSELLMPATDVTQQISLAGREASGTGNMKAVLNGALMMCTIDGANIEITEACGKDSSYEFGLLSEEVDKIKARGYNATDYYINSEKIRTVLDKLSNGLAGESFNDIVDYLLGYSAYKDSYLCLADFESYLEAHYKMDKEYQDKEFWNRKVLQNISSMGYFSSDRSIEEYVQKIWKLTKNK